MNIARFLAPILPLALGACISSYSVQHDEPLAAAPDTAVVCRYNWMVEDPAFRSDNVYSYQWGRARDFNHHLDGAAQALPGSCPEAATAARVDARISTHYVRYANKAARVAAHIPMSLIAGFTLGFAPMPLTDYFAVCLDVTAGDGLRRRGVVSGRLDQLINMWGTSNHRFRQGRDEHRQKPDDIMREMTVHAWRKAWATENLGSVPMQGCAETLDDVVKGTAPK